MKNVNTDVFLDEFEAEAKEHIEKIENAFLDVSAFAEDPKTIDAAFRAAHSMKGTAGFFSLEKIVAVTHELEGIFSRIKDGHLAVDEEVADLTLETIDCLKDLVNNIGNDDTIKINEITQKLLKYSNTGAAENLSVTVEIPFDLNDTDIAMALKNAVSFGHKIYYVNISFNRSLGRYYKRPDSLIDSILSIGTIAGMIIENSTDKIIKSTDTTSLAEEINSALDEHDTFTLEILATSVLDKEMFSMAVELESSRIRQLPKTIVPKPVYKNDGQTEKKDAPDEDNSAPDEHEHAYVKTPSNDNNMSIRLDVSAINSLMDLTNEMILTRNQLLSTVSAHVKTVSGIAPILQDMNRLTSAIQEEVMLTRMQPIGVIFGKFPRIVRDTAKALKKDIRVEIFGNDVKLDKYLLDSLTDPITQLIKNSADHGIESPEDRTKSGKLRKGTITLNAYIRDGEAVIEVSDDGVGMDTELIKQKVIERGLKSEEEISTMSRSDILSQVFEPGFSTSGQITNLSGRGVGMDIVKTNIEKLGGSIEIDTNLGAGTTMRLKMPLTLSVIRTLIITIGSAHYAVPELNVERIVRIGSSASSRRLDRINNSLVLCLDGRIIPAVTMDAINAKVRGLDISQSYEQYIHSGIIKCLILKVAGKSFALLIDDALETVQTLVKPLPVFFKECPSYSSVAVLGNGRAVAILDAEGITRYMNIDNEVYHEETGPEDNKNERQAIIFKCSGHEFYALDTKEISRIEKIIPENIQEIGTDSFINLADNTIRVIRPEHFAPVQNLDYTEEKLYLLTLKNCDSPIGLLAGKVLDKVEGTFRLDEDRIVSDFIFGTSIYNDNILIFLNPAAIAENISAYKNDIKPKGAMQN